METAQRRFVGGVVRVALVVLALFLVVSWISHRRVERAARNVRVERAVSPTEVLGPGDLRVFNSDTSVELLLRGPDVLAGLSPKTVARVQSEMERSSAKDTSGLGGMIASTVKRTVAASIGTHVVYPVSDIREVRYEDGGIVLETGAHGTVRLFNNTKVNRNDTKS